MKKKFFTPTCIVKYADGSSVMDVSQQIGVIWNDSWGENWDPFN